MRVGKLVGPMQACGPGRGKRRSGMRRQGYAVPEEGIFPGLGRYDGAAGRCREVPGGAARWRRGLARSFVLAEST